MNAVVAGSMAIWGGLFACATGAGDVAIGGASSATSATSTGSTGSGGGAGAAGGDGGSILLPSSCPPGELALGVDGAGKLICDQPGLLTPALADGCRLTFGYRDTCGTSCTSAPAKWGVVDSDGCEVSGAASTCNTTSLGGSDVELLALNTDGDVDENDRFYLRFECDAAEEAPSHLGPCIAGEWVTGVAPDGAVSCAPIAPAIVDWAHHGCRAFFGWRDACNGCTSAPARWGSVGALDCGDGLDPSNLCLDVMLNAANVEMYTLLSGGDVDDNDMFYFGLACDPPSTEVSSAEGACPEGEFVRAIEADGALACAPPGALAAEAMNGCTLYAGWRDSCSGCNLAPAKWGRARTGACVNDLGTNNVCTSADLGGQSVELFGLNPDGDVDENDSFYLGFRCE